MTPPKTIDQIRDEMAEEFYKKSGWSPTEWAVMNFHAGFDASTKYHEEKYRKLVSDLKNMLKLRELFTGKQFNDFFNDIEVVLKELI